MFRFSEVIRGWLGWCPNENGMQAKNRSGAGISIRAENPVKNPIPPGTDGPGTSWRGNYEHTQRGTLIIGGVAAAIIFILSMSFIFGPVWVTMIVMAILVFLLAIMSTLTVSAGNGILAIRFGPVGLICKSWPLSEIVSVTTVTNPWYYGYGIRITPYGPLYNVSGPHAVEVRLMSGKAFRIGTDEPYDLKLAIDQARNTRGARPLTGDA
nr:hypothetical protein [uncultured Methanoregula sp.]